MRLKIENCNDKKFILYLIKYLQEQILKNYNYRRLLIFEDYVNTIYQPKNRITSKHIIEQSIKSIVFKKFKNNTYIITIDQNKKLHGIKAKLYDVCLFINNGNLEIPGSYLYTKAFLFISENIQQLYTMYINEV